MPASEDGAYRDGLEMESDLIPEVVLEREDEDDLDASYYEGSGISEPEGEWVSISSHPDGYHSNPCYRKLRIRPDELEDYIGLLQEIQTRIDRSADTGTDR